MFELLFDCSAFKISATTQAINDVLFPIVLFFFIFWLLCEVFLTDATAISSVVENAAAVSSDDEILENLLADMATVIEQHKAKTELFDVEVERKNLKLLGLRALRDFCRDNKIKGYSPHCSQIDKLVGFLMRQQIYAHHIERFKQVISA